MINIIEEDILNAKENIIVHQVNCVGIMGGGLALQIAETYPHVKKEYIQYINKCKKNKVSVLGSVQFVPVDFWAVGMVNVYKQNEMTPYDEKYQFIANLFGQNDIGTDTQRTDLKSLKNGLYCIRQNAERHNATVAIPYKIGSCRGGAKWNDVEKIIHEVFDKSNVDVTIYKCDKG